MTKSGTKLSNRYLYAVLGLSILLNVIAGFYIFGKYDSGVSAKGKKSDGMKSSILHYESFPAPQDISRTSVLNTLVERYDYQSYLEIGQGDRIKNFDWIGCRIKIGVDPDISFNAAYRMTSDEFFAVNKDSFDLIFIDGLHHADQAEKDIVHALEVLNDNGTIVVHDCNPTTKKMQIVPRKQKLWTGDVWKTWVKLRATRPDLRMYVVDVDFGCGIIRKGAQETIELPERLTYAELDANRDYYLNLWDIRSFLNDLKGKSHPLSHPQRGLTALSVMHTFNAYCRRLIFLWV